MPDLVTRHFGVVDCRDDAVLLFPQGLPAFESARRFVLLEQPATSPVVFLQSLDNPDLCFLALPALAVDPQYDLQVPAEDLETIGWREDRQPLIGQEVACLAILTMAENRHASANLLAPVVIHLEKKTAVQAVRLDTRYSHRHSLDPQGATCS